MTLAQETAQGFEHIVSIIKGDRTASASAISAASTADRARANHTGTQSADTLTDGTTNKAFLATERTKLDGIATGATANSSDATLLARANHTGTQLASTISDFSTAADARVDNRVGTLSSLTTTIKTNVVAAINEVVSSIATASTNDRARANHTGTQTASTISDFNTAADARVTNVTGALSGLNTTAKGTLVASINEVLATQASGYAAGIQRANHTGTQTASTISDFNSAADARVDAKVGTLSSLTTTAKGSAVAAINELDAAIDALAAGSGAINDGATSTSTTWSSSKTNTEIGNAIAALVDGAPGTLNTLNEIAEALNDSPAQIDDILTALDNRVRYDASQTLTGPQQVQARANIGAASAADVGDTATDFVAIIDAALAA